jgi:hypothetical protein
MAASFSTDTLTEDVQWEELPDELLLRVLGHAMRQYGLKSWLGTVRGASRRWRALHDEGCTKLRVRDGVTDDTLHALCARLPSLTCLSLYGVASLTAGGLGAVVGLTALTFLILDSCTNVTDAVLRELRHLPALTQVNLGDCTNVTDVGVRELRGITTLTKLCLDGCTRVTDVGLRHLSSLTALTHLWLYGTATTKAGCDALKAALPAVSIDW